MRTIDADRLKAVLEKNFGHTGGASVLEQLIDEQPTIEPSTNCSEIPNSSDTISRQAAIDAIENSSKPYVWQGADIIRRLPTVQPEPHEGHWIEVAGELECSECHTVFTDLYPDYADSVACPHCGAKMTISK